MLAGERVTGFCSEFRSDRGYGFLESSSLDFKVFVHQEQLKMEGYRSLAVGESVEFTLVDEGKGRFRAEEVTGPGGAALQGTPSPNQKAQTRNANVVEPEVPNPLLELAKLLPAAERDLAESLTLVGDVLDQVQMVTAGKVLGTVTAFDAKRGFGFLKCTEVKEEVFVHQSAILKDGFRILRVGEKVEFELIPEGENRYKAVDVSGPGGTSLGESGMTLSRAALNISSALASFLVSQISGGNSMRPQGASVPTPSGRRQYAGIVTEFKPQKSYGFLKTESLDREVFIHVSNIASGTTLQVGDVVEFDVENTPDGRYNAVDLILQGDARQEVFKGAPRIDVGHNRLAGLVTDFDSKRGFGFVKCDALSRDAFIHVASVTVPRGVKSLEVGEGVEFDIEHSKGGYNCVNVVLLDRAEAGGSFHHGVVTAWKDGFGFIKSDGFNRDVFLHKSNIMEYGKDKVEPNDEVVFEATVDSNGRYNATNVRLAGMSALSGMRYKKDTRSTRGSSAKRERERDDYSHKYRDASPPPKRRRQSKYEGVVTGFNKSGFGFIQCPNFPVDVFVHNRNIVSGERQLYKNDTVEFDVETQADGRYNALNVTVVDADRARSPSRRRRSSRDRGSRMESHGRRERPRHEMSRHESSSRCKGTLTKYVAEKGYGFATVAGLDKSVFIHASECPEPLQEGHEIEFELDHTRDGRYNALRISIL